MANDWKKPMQWDNAGSEPSEALKSEGFKAGYKPPADIFNYFLHRAYECFLELQKHADEHKHSVDDVGAAAKKHSAQHSEDGDDPIAPYNIGAVDAMIGVLNGTAYTFDTALKQGEYNVQATDAEGAPHGGALYGKLIVTVSDGKEKTDSNWIWQEFLPASANKQRCWRMKINTGDWTDWFVLYDTGHKPSLSDIGAAAANHKHPYAIAIGYDRTDISSGADLNDILDMGCYRCSTATRAETLLNCPTKNAFILDMVASTGGNTTINPNSYTYGTQRVYALGGREYVRQVTSNGDGTIIFGEWITMYSTLDKPTPADIGAAPSGFGLGDTAKDISNKDLIAEVKGKSGFYRGANVTNAPNQYWWCFVVTSGTDTTDVICFGANDSVRTARFSHSATSIEWKEFSLSSHTHTANSLGVPTLLTGTPISDNEDLNNYTTAGNYYCGQSSTAGSLINCPTHSAFTMKVFYANGGSYYIGQEIIDYSTGVRYYRLYNASSKAWQSWYSTYSTSNKPKPADIGAAAASHGNHVPATQTASNKKFLRNDNTWQDVTPANIGAAASSHNQGASTITAGTFGGQVVANASGQAVGTSLLRNSKIVSADTNPTVNGEICWTYE